MKVRILPIYKEGLKAKLQVNMISLLYIYILLTQKLAMIDQDLQRKALEALQDQIRSQLSRKIMKSADLKELEIIESVYQKIVVEALLGQEQIRKTFLMLHQSRNGFIQQQKIGQSLLFQWITSIQMTKEVFSCISMEYGRLTSVSMIEQIPMLQQAQIKEEQPYQHSISYNSTPLQIDNSITIKKQAIDFPFINDNKQSQVSDNFNISDIIGCSQVDKQQMMENQFDNRQIMFYTHEQMMDQLKLELQATPAKTVGSTKIHHSEPEQDIKVQNVDCISNLPSPLQKLFIASYQQSHLYNEERAVQESWEYGHFLNGDKIEEILDIFYYKDQQYIIVKWKSRPNGQQPKNSTLLSQIVRYHCPHQLLAFYEERFPTLTL